MDRFVGETELPMRGATRYQRSEAATAGQTSGTKRKTVLLRSPARAMGAALLVNALVGSITGVITARWIDDPLTSLLVDIAAAAAVALVLWACMRRADTADRGRLRSRRTALTTAPYPTDVVVRSRRDATRN